MRILAASLLTCGAIATVGGLALIRWEAAVVCLGLLSIGAAVDLSRSVGGRR